MKDNFLESLMISTLGKKIDGIFPYRMERKIFIFLQNLKKEKTFLARRKKYFY